MGETVHLGFEVGSGAPVEIPLAHTFVSGQTQNSGKTTTLRAIVERSGRRALAFVTKRGEDLPGRTIRPYLPREGDAPIHWRLVETILAGALEQKSLKYERLWIINAAKGARTLEDVQANVRRLLAKTKNERSKDVYTLLDEYLELVVPQMRSLHASETLTLSPGLNVMDLSGIAAQTQAMVIRAALERINHHETDVLTVLPEAWEFAPRDRTAPVKAEAEAMARKGAAPKVQNFLLVDSQDIAGVSTVVRQACSVWLIGVQRELNELARAVKMMPAGIRRPKADDVATLQLGQFYACWSTHAVKVYVQPAWLDARLAIAHATGHYHIPKPTESTRATEDDMYAEENARLVRENEQLKTEIAALQKRLDAIERRDPSRDQRESIRREPSAERPAGSERERSREALGSGDGRPTGSARDVETLYPALLARLVSDAAKDPTLLKVIASKPELEVTRRRRILEASDETLRGRLAILIAEGWFDEIKAGNAAHLELQRRGNGSAKPNVYRELDKLAADGFVTKEDGGYLVVAGMKINIRELEPA